MQIETVKISIKQKDAYEKKKEELFDNLGNKDPDTIPRNLHLFTGNYKKSSVKSDKKYVARNSRFKMDNIVTYKDIKHDSGIEYVIDFPHRRIEFNDFLKTTGCNNFAYLNTGLPVDEYYKNEFTQWAERIESFYAKASIYK